MFEKKIALNIWAEEPKDEMWSFSKGHLSVCPARDVIAKLLNIKDTSQQKIVSLTIEI